MANRDLLREAIADAKAVKEVAIANAKAALEEAFTPQLQSMLSEKISQLDEEEITEDDLAEVDKEKQEEAKEVEKEGKEKTAKENLQEEEELEEDLDLEEILAELELEEGESETMEEAEAEMEEGMDDSMEEAEEAEGDDDAELDLENMTEDELQGFIEDVIEDMIEDGELVPGPNADESEAEEAEDTDDGMEGDADVDIEVDDIDLQEGEEKLEEDFSTEMIPQIAQALGIAVPVVKALLPLAGATAVGSAAAAATKIQTLLKGMKGKKAVAAEGKELQEAKTVIKHLQSELNEVNLLNSKLLYTNKIFRAKNLTENQKIKVLKAFDKAETVKEAKVIFESLNENLVAKSTKSNIKESMGFASKSAGVAPKRPITENVVEEDAMVSRFKKLAGIK